MNLGLRQNLRHLEINLTIFCKSGPGAAICWKPLYGGVVVVVADVLSETVPPDPPTTAVVSISRSTSSPAGWSRKAIRRQSTTTTLFASYHVAVGGRGLSTMPASSKHCPCSINVVHSTTNPSVTLPQGCIFQPRLSGPSFCSSPAAFSVYRVYHCRTPVICMSLLKQQSINVRFKLKVLLSERQWAVFVCITILILCLSPF